MNGSASSAHDGARIRVAAVKTAEHERPGARGVKIALSILALFLLLSGAWQQFAPRRFYDTFPGFGLNWVSIDGPFNEHLIRDLGGVNLALTLIVVAVIVRPTPFMARVAAIAVLVAQVPHVFYHAVHLDLLPTPVDRFLEMIGFAIVLIPPIFILIRTAALAPAETHDPSDHGVAPTANRLVHTPANPPSRH